MRVGLFYEWPNPNLRDWRTNFEEGLEQIQLAEELGFDFVLVAEHHFSNYGMSPAPLLQALAIAQRTKTIKIGTAVLVLPVWQPLRLAEEVAVLDNLTDGRFFCGIGRGYQPHEFMRYGATTEDSRDRFNEALDILIKAWTSDTSFTHDGRYYPLPNDTVVWPKPLQKPYPPIWIAGTSAETLRLAAERNFVPISTGYAGGAGTRQQVASMLQQRQALGLPVDDWEFGVQTLALVSDSDAQARADALKYARWQNRAGRALASLNVTNGRVNADPYPNEPDDDAFFNSIYYGDPDRVRAKYLSLAEAGATFASAWMMMGGIEHEKVMRSIRLMASEVLPAIRDVGPTPALAQELLALPVDAASAAAPRPQAPSDLTT